MLRLVTIIGLLSFLWTVPLSAQELQPGDQNFGHTTHNHNTYKLWFKEANAAILKQLGLSDQDFERLYPSLINPASTKDKPALQPGDDGFMREELNQAYHLLYEGGRCNCHYGYCRPTTVRHAKPGEKSPSGYMVLINRRWYPVPVESLFNENQVSPELWNKLLYGLDHEQGINGHVCAFMSQNGVLINECTMVEKPLG